MPWDECPVIGLGGLVFRRPVAVVSHFLDHYHQKRPYLKVVCIFLDHYHQSSVSKDRNKNQKHGLGEKPVSDK